MSKSVCLDKKDLIKAVEENVRGMHQGIEMHRSLISSILEQKMDENDLRPLLDMCPLGSRELMLREAIRESIDVLEESRKAFKSKRLEILRKKLTQVLIDAA